MATLRDNEREHLHERVAHWIRQAEAMRSERDAEKARADALAATLAEAVELLRRHRMDWGNCENEPGCGCSHSQAGQFLMRPTVTALTTDDTPEAT